VRERTVTHSIWDMPGLEVTLVLCTAGGTLLGATAPFPIANQWWRDVEETVTGAREALGLEVRVLRILQASSDTGIPRGGRVAYLAEVDTTPGHLDLNAWPDNPLRPDPKRLGYAEPGGHQRDLDWATDTLAARGVTVTAAPTQIRTWNLSSIWRLTTSTGLVWLKVTPPFCASEAAIMPLLDQHIVPTVLGASPSHVLLADVPGQDQYDAGAEELRTMAHMLISLQASWAARVPDLEALGVFDKRGDAALPQIHAVADRSRHELDQDTRRGLEVLVEDLPRRFAALEDCGLPDTLVHGDFHPGNVRGNPGDYRILDWGDCGIGNPLLDLRAFFEYFTPADQVDVIDMWQREWSRQVPGCDVTRAVRLVRPLGPLYGALVYQMFLDNIEQSERPYHEGDPARALRRAVSMAAAPT
jgi:Phosphotransferase enzyme family